METVSQAVIELCSALYKRFVNSVVDVIGIDSPSELTVLSQRNALRYYHFVKEIRRGKRKRWLGKSKK